MERQPRQAHVRRGRGDTQATKNQAQSVGVCGLDPTFGSGDEELLQSLVPKCLDRHSNHCNPMGYDSPLSTTTRTGRSCSTLFVPGCFLHLKASPSQSNTLAALLFLASQQNR